MTLSRRDFIQLSVGTLAAACATPGGAGARKPAPPPTRILILGGTSFLGPALVDAARARGAAVTLFNRGRTNPGLFPDVEQLHGDRDGKLEALRGRTWDVAVDTSGFVPRVVRMSAEALAPAVERYLYVSSISAYDESIPPGSGEEARLAALPDPATEDVAKAYGGLKAACEAAAAAAMPGRVLVVRPGLIVGPRDPTDRFTYWPVRIDRGGEVLAPGDGGDPVQFIDVRDLAAWMIAMAERRASGTYNAVGPASRTSMRAMLGDCRAAIPSTTAFTWVPWPFLEKEKVEPWSDMPVWIPASAEGSGLAQVSPARAIAAGLEFRPIGETARDTLSWWKSQPEARRKLRAGISAERELLVLKAWREGRATP